MIISFPGVKRVDDDTQILLMMEAEGLLKKWESLKDKFKDMARVLVYDTKDERWVIWECIGIPGDEGLMSLLIKKNMLGHPRVRHALLSLAIFLQLDPSTVLEFQHTPPERDRN